MNLDKYYLNKEALLWYNNTQNIANLLLVEWWTATIKPSNLGWAKLPNAEMKLSPSFFIKEQHHFRKCTIFLSRLLVFDGLMKNDRNVLIVHETIHNED